MASARRRECHYSRGLTIERPAPALAPVRAGATPPRRMTEPSFPALRMRRGRSAAWMREMLAEHRLDPSDLILPMFVCEGQGCEEPIASLRGVSRWSVDRLADR